MDVDVLRAGTPGCRNRIHLNNAGAALMSQQTLDAIVGHLGLEARIGGYEAADAAADRVAAVYAGLAELLGGRTDEIALFDNATHAWQAAFYSVPLRPGDRVLTGRNEYGSNVLAYLQAARRVGAEVVVVPNDADGQLDTAALAGLIDGRTRLIGVTHVPTAGGLVNPAAEVGRIARAAGVPYLLDATQSVGQFPVDVDEIGCDFLCGTGRKFLRGPRGTGFLWVRSGVLEQLDPHVAEIQSAEWDGARGFDWVPGAQRFATWELNYAAVLGLGAAVDQALNLGLDEIGKRNAELGDRMRGLLEDTPGVTVHDLGRERCAIVTAQVDGVEAELVVARLAESGVNVTSTEPAHQQFDTEERNLPPLVRFSAHYYNTEDELEHAAALVGAMVGKRL
ncbi:selenocysteine lyase/cysteine desulfurase [Actinoplanes octamycinicus]|uniref:Selenocysteine lyase/cysteine desulfurase n=1 Tax=Actinoplanes octamycinicus TaxID=135948 RepID=A0A7W7H7H3_9ACTN|nr:aminotransferase class V-fold PLP-dependent enzyme [Actinoplanes octamycinicus]MBB4745450.1 selenocysteine lyase/cysteine desulfurase [Actinoplanes octamycinicus]GIE56294.1 aminotransferase class V [Actinoplanes octamycinicus]